MTSSRDQRRNRPSPRKTRSVSESRFTRHFDNGKTRPAKPPDAPTIPIGAAHISFSGQHRMRHPTSKTKPRVSTRGPSSLLSSDQHLEKHWPGGAKIKMTLESATPKGKVGGGEANGKTKVGPYWRSFIQSELSRGSHKSPNRVRNEIGRAHV